jgi:hypothetical protein
MLAQFHVTALKDYASVLGLVLRNGAKVQIDVEEERLPDLQKCVDAGDVAIDGLKPSAPEKAKK